MTTLREAALAAAMLMLAASCHSGDQGSPGGAAPVDSGGSAPGGSGGGPSIPGSDTGGTSGTGGTVSTGSGGAPTVVDAGGTAVVDAPVASPASDGATASSDGGAVVVGPGGEVEGWYEAEAIPPNEKAERTENHPMGQTPCPTKPPKPGDNCSSGGGEVTWITEGRQGWLQYNGVAAPSDGMYDVTWWYHCGNNDNFGDKHCGGQTNPPTTAAGCRPHNIVVNGTELPGTYHFPCFAGSFGIIRAATTALPLKAGMNSIKVYARSRDAADMDALQVQSLGKGIGPLIMSNNVSGVN
jgi:hypothetical protein